ncbi:MAG: AMP-binding protein [Rhodospirillaceae bacterium]
MTGPGIEIWPGYREIPEYTNLCWEAIDRQINAGLGGKVAFVYEGGKISYSELLQGVSAFSRGLIELGLAPGDRILIRLRNSLEYVFAYLGSIRAGIQPVLQNSLLSAAEVQYVIEHSGAVAAVSSNDVAGPLRDLRSKLPKGLIVSNGAWPDEIGLEQFIADNIGPTTSPANTKAEDPAFIVYTSGTTGRPKGIVHAHRWIIAQGDMNKLRIPPERDDVVLATGEWSFISALGHNLCFALRNGITGAILSERPSSETILGAIEKFKVTLLYSVATVYRRILAIKDVEKNYLLSTLRGCNATGEALEAATYNEWINRFGCPIWEHYGVSELQLVFGQNPHWPIKPGSVGKPLEGTSVEVLDEDYQTVPVGEIGHLLIDASNPGFFLGYHNDPEKTAEVVHDGWYHTGDLAKKDEDGYIWIVGRSDDCFKSRGIFISPIEIEDAIRQHEGIAEVCVVPVKDPDIGNKIRAVIVLRDGIAGSTRLVSDIRRSLERCLASYKHPHTLEFVDQLPKSPVGKVLRRKLTLSQ